MPERIFLPEPEPMVVKTARWLVGQSPSLPCDLSEWLVVLPTAGAGRRLRAELLQAAPGTGLLPPATTTPMGLLTRHDGEDVASRTESLRAWIEEISRANSEKFPLLFSGFPELRTPAHGIAQSLAEICSILAEAGLTPSASEILQACPQDEMRWREIDSLYRRYLKHLQTNGFCDANRSHLATAKAGTPPPEFSRILLAGVSDLSPLLETYLTTVPLPVALLTDAAGCQNDASFDAWGRPDPEYWTRQTLPDMDPVILADPSSEARAVSQLLGPAGLCVADPALVPLFQRSLTSLGHSAFDPAGLPLSRFEPAAILRLAISFFRSGHLATLRALLEHPAFQDAFCQDADLTPAQALSSLDELATKDLLTGLTEALAGIRRMKRNPEKIRLLQTAKVWRDRFDTSRSLEALPNFLEAIYATREVENSSPEAAALSALAPIVENFVEASRHPSSAEEELLAAELTATPVYGSHPAEAIELNGWLEAPWLSHSALVISGCTEGALPAGISGHPFLPESLRVKLGLPDNATRLARDIHQFQTLLASRPPGAVRITLSRSGLEGDPSRPSRLLFRCPDEELPARVERLFGPARSLRDAPARQPAWQLRLPELPPPERLSVTAFASYLNCPLRFYLQRVLKMEAHDPLKSEMDALDFGDILHRAIESFSQDPILRDSPDESEIADHVLQSLDSILLATYGLRPPLPIRVQRESLRARLRQFAVVQARERRDGWQIVEAEIAFPSDDTLKIEGLPLTGKIDRIEIHRPSGQRRILDYKSYPKVKGKLPTETHLTSLSEPDPDFPEAETVWNDKPKRWAELQLPLYRALAEYRWPEDSEPVQTGYFLLPEKTEETGIHAFPDDEDLQASALACAKTIAKRVQGGIFWPPRKPKYEDFEALFLDRSPEEALSADSITFLQGQ